MNILNLEMERLITEARNCKVCLPYLPHGVNPVFAVHQNSRIAIVGQAPGSIVHKTGIPWDDKSGERLREWLDVDNDTFYDPKKIALVPMGFCYPGKGKSGDLPPRPECAPLWHEKLFSHMKTQELIILIGAYAQTYYLKDKRLGTLTETVQNYSAYLPDYFVLPHPSPRNNIWLKKNPWFESELLPDLQKRVSAVLK